MCYCVLYIKVGFRGALASPFPNWMFWSSLQWLESNSRLRLWRLILRAVLHDRFLFLASFDFDSFYHLLFFMLLLYFFFSITSMFFFIFLEIFFNKLLTCAVHMVIYKHKQQNKHSHRRCECLRDNRRKMICQNF